MLRIKSKSVKKCVNTTAGYIVDLNAVGQALAYLFIAEPHKLDSLYSAARNALRKLQKEKKDFKNER